MIIISKKKLDLLIEIKISMSFRDHFNTEIGNLVDNCEGYLRYLEIEKKEKGKKKKPPVVASGVCVLFNMYDRFPVYKFVEFIKSIKGGVRNARK